MKTIKTLGLALAVGLALWAPAAAQGTKISAMPAASTLDGSELLPIVQAGVNKKSTVDQMRGRKVVAITSSATPTDVHLTDEFVAVTSGGTGGDEYINIVSPPYTLGGEGDPDSDWVNPLKIGARVTVWLQAQTNPADKVHITIDGQAGGQLLPRSFSVTNQYNDVFMDFEGASAVYFWSGDQTYLDPQFFDLDGRPTVLSVGFGGVDSDGISSGGQAYLSGGQGDAGGLQPGGSVNLTAGSSNATQDGGAVQISAGAANAGGTGAGGSVGIGGGASAGGGGGNVNLTGGYAGGGTIGGGVTLLGATGQTGGGNIYIQGGDCGGTACQGDVTLRPGGGTGGNNGYGSIKLFGLPTGNPSIDTVLYLTPDRYLKVSGGSGASAVYPIENSGTYDPPSLATLTGATTTLTATGAATGDFVQVSFSNLNTNQVILFGWVSSANTVSIRFFNTDTSTHDMGSGTLRVRVTEGR